VATYLYSPRFTGPKIDQEISKLTIDALYEALRVGSHGEAGSQLPALITEVLARTAHVQTLRALNTPEVNPVCVIFQRERASRHDLDLKMLKENFRCFKVKFGDDGSWVDTDDVGNNIAKALSSWV
jgi:hypothetical protein